VSDPRRPSRPVSSGPAAAGRASLGPAPAASGRAGQVGSEAGGGRVIVEADGGSRGNPGPAGYGALVRDADTGAVLVERNEAIGVETNNVAEYRGLIAGLSAAAELGAERVAVRMDSKLVVEQMAGRWQVKSPGLRSLARQAAELRSKFVEVTFTWVPRAQNKHADRLVNEAIDAAERKAPKTGAGGAAGSGWGAPDTDGPAQPDGGLGGLFAAPARSAAESTSPTGRADSGREPAPAGGWVPPHGTPTRLVLVRHGATERSAERRFSGSGDDVPLDARGEAQAAALARRFVAFSGGRADGGTALLAGRPAALDDVVIVSSPLARAWRTAEVIAAGRPVRAVAGLVEESFGAWEGATFAEARERWPEELAAWQASADAAPPGGESLAAVARRVRRARDEIIASAPGRTVLAVTHVTPIKTLLRLALDAPPTAMFRMHLDTASVSVIDYFADGSCSVRLVNDTSHLV